MTTLAAPLGMLLIAFGIDPAQLVWICLAGLAAVFALIWTVLAVLLLRASLRVNGRGFERVIYLIKLALHVPLYLRQRPTREAEVAVRRAIMEPPPRPKHRIPHCPECLLHGTDLQHQTREDIDDGISGS
ncbi:hypothetical protein [Actinomadura sp. NBRC 104425]|uniref:hypothetical protein n=1 Tax=Actinomadura sp. NBRC 104425 TaxID=3032204 RepID=UPI002552AF2A|nr:hypothetical protein [Actinomadura sp. NBRC 104425]